MNKDGEFYFKHYNEIKIKFLETNDQILALLLIFALRFIESIFYKKHFIINEALYLSILNISCIIFQQTTNHEI